MYFVASTGMAKVAALQMMNEAVGERRSGAATREAVAAERRTARRAERRVLRELRRIERRAASTRSEGVPDLQPRRRRVSEILHVAH